MEDINDPQKLFERGLALIKRGYPADAVEYFEKALEMGNKNSVCYSWLGLAIARSRGSMSRAEELCRKAVKDGFYWPQHYLNLAEVYMLLGKKSKAIKALEAGLKVDGSNHDILNELQMLGIRKNPPIPFLSRSNPINKYLGIISAKLGLKK